MPDTDTDRIDEQELVIDGNVLTVDDLAAIRDALEDPEASLEDAPIAEFYLALIYTVKKRDNPELTIDDALDWKLKDFLRPVEKGPTKAPRKR
jgi:hypothetical protein